MAFLNSLTTLNSILHLHTNNQEASTGWARHKINNTKTPNWFIICLLYNKFQFAGIFISELKIYTVFRDILSICQLHIFLSRTAKISLELHFCVELHTRKSPEVYA